MNKHQKEAEKQFNTIKLNRKCPYCDDYLIVIAPAYYNISVYRGSVVTKALCCGKPINLFSRLHLMVSRSDRVGNDDWNQRLIDPDKGLFKQEF